MRMKNFNLTPRVKKALEQAQELAKSLGHERINCAHVFKTIMELDYPMFRTVFRPFMINQYDLAEKIIPFVEENHPAFFKKKTNQKTWHNEIEEILKFANDTSSHLNQEYVGVEHILYALIMTSPTVRGFLEHSKFPIDDFSELLISHLDPSAVKKKVVEKVPEIEGETAEKQSYIKKYCTNLTELALQNKLNNVFGRDVEIATLAETILRKTKNNIILIGDPGVGKTAIVEGLAYKIMADETTPLLKNKIVISLNMASMIAGTKYRGQFEQRFQGLLDELKKNLNYIVFIDEIHTMIGAGNGEGALDVANMLKPALARGEITCIGATTHAEYKKLFEKDGALKRRFEALTIEEPNKEQTKKILMSSKIQFEQFHGVIYSEEIIEDIIFLCEKYIPYRKFPDKAFDIIDLLGSKAKITSFVIPKKIKNLESKIKKNLDKLDDANHSDECQKMIEEFGQKLVEWAEKGRKFVPITTQNLIDAFAEKLNINKNKIVFANNLQNENILDVLKSDIYGQDEGLEKICNILMCSKAGLKQKNKPMGKFLFVGPTGVGKTWTAKLLAEKFFGNDKSLLKLDMSEYQESSSINKLIGSAIGYVKCEEGGVLTEFVRNRPNSVILFDEIEKSHRDINNLLLQIMDDGYLTDNLGRRIDFSNSIIILTSNLGHEQAAKPSMGFLPVEDSQDSKYKKSIENFFKPEFLARLDDVVVFNKISKHEFRKIFDRMIEKTSEMLAQNNKTILISEETKSFLLKKIEENGNNARSIQKVYRQYFEIPLAKFILRDSKPEISAKISSSEVIFE
jgi:ATP-dependent Clp protease ATP-binding subunit ClpC